MPRSSTIRVIRTTRANLNGQAGSTNLIQGEPYLITDENRLAIGTTTSTYQDFFKTGESITSSQLPALSGDISSSSGSSILTLNTVNSNVGSFGTGIDIPVITVNAKGLVTAVSTSTLPAFTSSTNGLVPASGGGTTNFLRADGSWATPPSGGGGGGTVITPVDVTVDFGTVGGGAWDKEFIITDAAATTTKVVFVAPSTKSPVGGYRDELDLDPITVQGRIDTNGSVIIKVVSTRGKLYGKRRLQYFLI